MIVKDGRFGPYVTDGEYNASLRKGDTVEELTVERGGRAARRPSGQGPGEEEGVQEEGVEEEGVQEEGGQEEGLIRAG